MVDTEVTHGGSLQKSGSQGLSTSRFPYTKFPSLRQPLLVNSWRHRTEQEKIELAQRLKEEVERLSEYNERLKRRKAFAKNTVSDVKTKTDRWLQEILHEQTIIQERKRGHHWPFHRPPDYPSQCPQPTNMTSADKPETRQEETQDLVLPKIVMHRATDEKSEELVPAVTDVVETHSHRKRNSRIGTFAGQVVSRKRWRMLSDKVKDEEAATPTCSWTKDDKHCYRIFMHMSRITCSMASRRLRRKWKSLIAMVRLIVGLRWEFIRRSRVKDPSLTTFLDFGDEMSHKSKDGMVVIKQKPVTEVSPSSKAVSILCKPHYARTEDDIETVLTNLRYLKGFHSFPEDVQVKLAKYGMHMEVGANRVIVRQGHDPQFWFFVICGQALATEISESHKSTRSVLSQGDAFVEGDFENDCPRTCSVTSRKDMQLLVISKEHYWQIFQSKSLQDKYPGHLEFIRHMDFMKFWPCDVLLKYPSQCYQQYFKHDVVLCNDSTKSNYIFIVRTGTCAVYTYVDAVEASWKDLELWLANPMVDIDGWPVGKTDTRFAEKRPNRYQLYQRFSARNLQATNLAAISCLHLSSGLPSKLEESQNIEDFQTFPHKMTKMHEWPLTFLPKRGSHKKEKWLSRMTKGDNASIESPVDNQQFDQQSNLLSSLLQLNVLSQSILKDTSNNRFKQKPKTWNSRPSCRKTTSSWHRRKNFRVPPECIPRKASNVSGSQQRHKYTGTGPPVYIKMETLHSGDVFGLDQLEEPGWEKRRASGSVALVSMGAEVILLNKAFYTSLSTVSSFGEVQRTMHIYPSHDAMQARYKLHIAWSLYADKVCDEFYAELRKKGHHKLGTFFHEPHFRSLIEQIQDED